MVLVSICSSLCLFALSCVFVCSDFPQKPPADNLLLLPWLAGWISSAGFQLHSWCTLLAHYTLANGISGASSSLSPTPTGPGASARRESLWLA